MKALWLFSYLWCFMARLFIAEKPSLGRAIVAALPKPHQNHQGYIQAANGDIVTWCVGHLLEQAEPDAYHEKYKKWRFDDLPILPTQWILHPKKSTSKQLTVIKKCLKQNRQIIHAGDPDREGQLLVDEVFEYAKLDPSKKKQILRLLISDLNLSAVKKALDNLKNNIDFMPLSVSALARSRADWLYGMNMTRACTLQGQKFGYQGVLSIGRVQTPILGLVVMRDEEIEHFVSKPFYEVMAQIRCENNEQYFAKWKPSKACEPYMDEENRVVSKPLAENVIARVSDKKGEVIAVTLQNKKQAPPLPFNLSALQIEGAKRFGISAQIVLDVCQKLYERHKLITYPRSDCRHLPLAHFKDKKAVLDAIASTCPKLQKEIEKADLNLRSKAWNDAKVTAHHAIIPTSKASSTEHLSTLESNVYQLIAQQYLLQFYSAFEYQEKQIDSQISGGLFIAKQKQVISQGWKALLGSYKNEVNLQHDDDFSENKLPDVKKGDVIHCLDAKLICKQTTIPSHFNDASLLGAMTGIARYVTCPSIKKVLRDTDGLGTQATRAGIIELLFKRHFLERKGKNIVATDIARHLIEQLPKQMSSPDMTAHWEYQLNAISLKKMKYKDFMDPLASDLHSLLDKINQANFDQFKGKGNKASRRIYKKKSKV